MKSRRGVADAFFWVVILFVLAIFGTVIFQIISAVNTEVQQEDDLAANAKAQAAQLDTQYPLMFDNIMMVMVIGSGILLFLSSFFIGDFPGFFFLVFIVAAILVIISAGLAAAWDDFYNDQDISSATAGEFVFLPFLLGNWPFFAVYLVSMLLFGLYVKSRVG